MSLPYVIAVDFDGTIFTNKFPQIGEPKIEFIKFLIALQKQRGVKLILWTCREDKTLAEAIAACSKLGLVFDAHNENLPEMNAYYKNNSRKVGADLYIDDRAYNPNEYSESIFRARVFNEVVATQNIREGQYD